MPTREQKLDKQNAVERRRDMMAKRASAGIEPFDNAANCKRQSELHAFQQSNGEAFAQWWATCGRRDVQLLKKLATFADHPNTCLAENALKLMPELSESWLATNGKDEVGLAQLLAARAANDSVDDGVDVAAVKLATKERGLPTFPGLDSNTIDNGFVGIGGQTFDLTGEGYCERIERGQQVFSVGAKKMDILMGELRGQLARTSDFRWAVHRQDTLNTMLLEAIACFQLPPPAEPSKDPEADAALEAAVASGSLDELRAAIEALASRASLFALADARAARDKLAKKAKKARAKAKQGEADAAGGRDDEGGEATTVSVS